MTRPFASLKSLAAACALAFCGAAPAVAADALSAPQGESAYSIPFLDELRLGGLYTNPDQKETGAVVQIEAVFSQFITHDFGNTYVNAIFSPRPHLGANINVTGETSAAFAGLTWQFPIIGPLFVEGEFGGAVHNGELSNAGPNRQQLGCRFLFHEVGSIGLQFNRFSILGTIEHFSNAGICEENDGLTNVGIRVGYKF